MGQYFGGSKILMTVSETEQNIIRGDCAPTIVSLITTHNNCLQILSMATILEIVDPNVLLACLTVVIATVLYGEQESILETRSLTFVSF